MGWTARDGRFARVGAMARRRAVDDARAMPRRDDVDAWIFISTIGRGRVGARGARGGRTRARKMDLETRGRRLATDGARWDGGVVFSVDIILFAHRGWRVWSKRPRG